MAHTGHGTLRAMAAIALLALAADADALSLGDPLVGSPQGEPLDVRFPIGLERGESIQPSCFKLAAGAGPGAPLAAGTVSLERSAIGTMLRLRSATRVEAGGVSVSIVARCSSEAREYRREYSLRAVAGAAPGIAEATPSSSIAATQPAPLLPSIATLIARIGDTLESIARAIFPANRTARASYIQALRASNAPLASLRDDEPIPVDTPVALPDLRAFSQAQRAHAFARPESTARRAAAQPALPEKAAPIEKPAPTERPAPAKKPAAAARPPRAPLPHRETAPRPTAQPLPAPVRGPAPPPREAPASHARGDFALKLSSPVIDLSRSRGIDERSRAQLRERLTLLDADDQVSALLALQHSVKQLETQVAQLQLKLSGMPSSFPVAPGTPPAPAAVAVPSPPEPKAAPAPAPQPPKAESANLPPSEPNPVLPEVKSAPEEAKPAPAQAKPAPTPVPAKETPRPALPVEQPTPWMDYVFWALAVLLAWLAGLLAWRLAQRVRTSRAQAEEAEELPGQPPPRDDSIVVAEEPVRSAEPAPMAAPTPARREIDSDVALPTRIPSNTEDLRQRYIEERFPEIGKGAVVLDDPDSVVKGARLFYEDGALARAVELLHYAIERRPGEIKLWLALFEIFRLERLPGEFAQLAARFKEQHGKSDYWRKVRYFGREIDPGNALYAAPAIDSFETIGPAQAKRIAADNTVDPIAENWLGAPMDFQNEVLANELRKTLMADAGINEQDLVPNPMPALRNVEMFSVA